MPINMNDPRTRKTRQGLRDALIRLILRQGYATGDCHEQK